MEYNYEYYPADHETFSVNSNKNKDELEKIKQMDKGYNKIWRMIPKNGKLKRTKIEVYTTSGIGHHIRDAETGDYYPYMVGSLDEHLFFSVILATGECNSANGSSTLFYLSPEKYMKHLNETLDNSIIAKWNERKNNRINQNKLEKQPDIASYFEVK
jgi:hypothetical protein